MHMDQLMRAGRLMQAIDVLRHGEDAAMLPLQPRQLGVRRIRLGLAMQPAAEIVEFVHSRRVAGEAFGRGDLLEIELLPQAALVAERAEPALRRKASASEDDDVVELHSQQPVMPAKAGIQ